MLLGVNIDHIATIRQARKTPYPDLLEAARIAERAGADAITLHLREDRRHIQDGDVFKLRNAIETRMNLEMAATQEMVEIAKKIQPEDCCVVPEKREELTTEGGLDVVNHIDKIKSVVVQLSQHNIRVSLFIEPDFSQLEAAADVGAPVVELHTGTYANLHFDQKHDAELKRIYKAVEYGNKLGLVVNAGHGLDYDNVTPIAEIAGINELNIGHSIVAKALFDGLDSAVKLMKEKMA